VPNIIAIASGDSLPISP